MNLKDDFRNTLANPQKEHNLKIADSRSNIKTDGAWLLYRGIKSLLQCDESETVQGIVRYVISKYDSLRVGSEFVERHRRTSVPLIAAFLGAITRFLEGKAVHRKSGGIWIARLDNERRAIEEISKLLPELQWTELRLRRPPDASTVFLLTYKLFPLRKRIVKLTRLLLRREQKFFKILRVIEMIGYYARFLEIFQNGNYSFAIMSSHSNPHGIAFNMAARRCEVSPILITHGMPVRPVARLKYDLAVVHCELARRIYEEAGCHINRTLVHGRQRYYAAMPNQLPEKVKIGIFLCKDVHEKVLDNLVRRLLANSQTEQILIRPHPKNLFMEIDDWLSLLDDNRIRRSFNESVNDDLKECDVVFGGNSSVLVEAVTAGRVSGYIYGLDYGSFDLHEFIARRLIYQVKEEINFNSMLHFYMKPKWIDILQLYANVNESEESVAEQFRDALQLILQKRRLCKPL